MRLATNLAHQGIFKALTHWDRVTHIFVGNLTIIGSCNGLSPDQHQAITFTSVALLSIEPFGTNFSGILFEIQKSPGVPFTNIDKL